jgi:uncharacterized protein YmfQ (DUF2313 family)
MGQLSDQDYEQELKTLFPQGLAWILEGTVFENLVSGIAPELARVDRRASDLINELDPRTTSELLTDWERVLGLPDGCTGQLGTLQERRNAIVAKLNAIGGQSREYFIALAATHGFEITVEEFRPFQAGVSRAGENVNSQFWRFAWRVNAPETTVWAFRAGQSTAGEPLRNWGNKPLECLIRKYKPAHTHPIFAYGG